jgi:hypothetical protein
VEKIDTEHPSSIQIIFNYKLSKNSKTLSFFPRTSNSGRRSSFRLTKCYFRVMCNQSIIKIVASNFIFLSESMRQSFASATSLPENFSRQAKKSVIQQQHVLITSFSASSGSQQFVWTAVCVLQHSCQFTSFWFLSGHRKMLLRGSAPNPNSNTQPVFSPLFFSSSAVFSPILHPKWRRNCKSGKCT